MYLFTKTRKVMFTDAEQFLSPFQGSLHVWVISSPQAPPPSSTGSSTGAMSWHASGVKIVPSHKSGITILAVYFTSSIIAMPVLRTFQLGIGIGEKFEV